MILTLLLAGLSAGAAQPAHPALQPGQEALAAGRFEEARAQFEAAAADGKSYDALVGLGVALGRLSRLDEAAARLSAAVAIDPQRSEAWLERGGVRFLQGRHAAAVRDLEASLARQDDAYARDLLASSLFLDGRTEDALRQWNRLDRPRLRVLDIQGIEKTRPILIRRAICMREGTLLAADQYGASRLRLRELGVFERTTLRLLPLADGQADVEVALSERHGLADSPFEFIAATGVDVVSERAQLRYVNLMGLGVTIAGRYRWQPTRPEISLGIEWPQPLGLGGKLRVAARSGRQRFALDEPLDRRLHGVDVTYRMPVRNRLVVELALGVASRSYSRPHPATLPGTEAQGRLVAAGSLLETFRHRIDGQAVLAHTLAKGITGGYGSGELALTYKGQIGPMDEARRERSVLAVHLQAGRLTARAPLDALLTPGGSPDMEWPLRAHQQARDGVLGVMPLVRTLAIGSVEWRQRLYKAALGEAGIVIFCDVAWLPERADVVGSLPSARRLYEDVGAGLRVGLSRSALVRLDVGYGLADRSHAIFLGLGQTF